MLKLIVIGLLFTGGSAFAPPQTSTEATPNFESGGLAIPVEDCPGVITRWGIYAHRTLGRPPFPFTIVRIPSVPSHHPDSTKGIFDIRKGTDPQFERNHLLAFKVFERFFRGVSRKSFREMLVGQHFIACMGPSGSTPYLAKAGDFTYSTADIYPGVFRHDKKNGLRQRYPSRELKVGKSQIKEIVAIMNTVLEIPINTSESSGWNVAMPRIIDPSIWPEVGFRPQHGWVVEFPPRSEHVDKYLDAAEQVMIMLQDLRWSPVTHDSQTREWFIDLLGDYYQLMLSVLPFVRVNESLIMPQINYILKFFGFSPIPHRLLFPSAAILPNPAWKKVFRYVIYEYNSWIPKRTRREAVRPPIG